jgi:hypothetical protein
LGIFRTQVLGHHAYVGIIQAQTIFKPSDIEELWLQFRKAGYRPGDQYSEVDLENIYMTATDEKNLVANLSSRKFINPVSSKSQMQFFNPILGKYARVCDLKKQINDLEKEQGTVDNSIKDKQSQIGPNPTLKDSLTKDIQTKKTDIENIKRKVSEIKSECDRLERLTMDELQEMQKEIQSGTKEVNQARSQN